MEFSIKNRDHKRIGASYVRTIGGDSCRADGDDLMAVAWWSMMEIWLHTYTAHFRFQLVGIESVNGTMTRWKIGR